jgi:DNA-binding transcriptional LysR family regulator
MPILAWADANVGIAIVPRAAIGLIPSTNLIFKTISDPCINIASAVIWMRNRHLSAAARHFLTLFTTINETPSPPAS